jgi:CRP-like cAMP-binding protein
MPRFKITNKLLNTPLFQGISKSDLHNILGHTKFDFGKYNCGNPIVKANDPCTSMIFLLDGIITVLTISTDHSYKVSENISAPLQLQPERLFGLHQRYTSSFYAKTICNTMSLQKSEVIALYNNYEVFRINLINQLAAGIQKSDDRNWASGHLSLRMRIARFFTYHCLRPAGEKTFKIKMDDLAKELNDSRLNISIELNKLQDENLVELSRGQIHIPALEHLYM